MEGHGRSFPITRLTFQARKDMGGGGWGGGLQDYSVRPSSSPFPLDLGFGFGTWTWDLDLGSGLGTGLGLDNLEPELEFYYVIILDS